ncbi:MAG: P-II family nitrogen regulator [Pseudomonadota bacterium]|nr:P-II family nitrogen regulator [Pseudomonadota bacterium]
MDYRKVTAIVRQEKLAAVERALHQRGVPGISVTKVKGYGDLANFYSSDWLVSHSRIEIFIRADQAEGVAECIVNAATTGLAGDGLVAVLPVEKLYRVREGAASGEDAA